MTRSMIRFLIALTFFLSGCSNLPAPSQVLNHPTPGAILGSQSIVTVTPGAEQQSQKDFLGLVVDMDGKAIAGAKLKPRTVRRRVIMTADFNCHPRDSRSG